MYTVQSLKTGYQQKTITPEEVLKHYQQRIADHNSTLNVYTATTNPHIPEKNNEMPLHGIPFANKDVISHKNIPTQAASHMLEAFTPVKSAHVIECLESSGAVCLGNANTDEFAQGSSTENSYFGVTKNPWDTTRVAGGSSGGSAAAVAADLAVFALGTDTGGSIRQPASFCGVTGLKVSYGRVSRQGVFSYGSSLDSVGIFTKNVADISEILPIIAQKDSSDMTSLPSYINTPLSQPTSKKYAYITEFLDNDSIDPRIRSDFERLLQTLTEDGAEIIPVSLPVLNAAIAVYYLIAKAEGSTNYHRYDGIRYGHHSTQATSLDELYALSRDEGFGKEVKRCILLGNYTLSAGQFDAYFMKAAKMRRLIHDAIQTTLADIDGIITPVSPFLPFPIGQKTDDILAMYLADMFTVPVNLAGNPAITLPVSVIDGLPNGIQIIGKTAGESSLLQTAHYIENLVGFTPLQY